MGMSVVVILLGILGLSSAIPSCCDCDLMVTGAGSTKPEVLPSPFVINVHKYAYRTNDRNEFLKVTLQSTKEGNYIKQFMLQAVKINSMGTVVDTVNLDAALLQLSPVEGDDGVEIEKVCQIIHEASLTTLTESRENKVTLIYLLQGTGHVKFYLKYGKLDGLQFGVRHLVLSGKAVKSVNSGPKFAKNSRKVQFSFAPRRTTGPIKFRATFLGADDRYWVRELSEPIVQIGGPPLDPSIVRKNALPLIDPIHTDVCGTEKGCYRVPEGCWEPYCDYIATWKPLNQVGGQYLIEMSARVDGITDRYVSLALSEDTRWGGDRVFECVHDGGTGLTEVYQAESHGHSTQKFKFATDGINQTCVVGDLKCGGQFYEERIRCRFIVRTTQNINSLPLSGRYHLLMSRGPAENGNTSPHKYGHGEYPVASPDMVLLSDVSVNMQGYSRYPLVKAHGILMILAWCFFGTTGLLLTKYYKPMWPNKRFYGQRYWFVGHFNCMAWVFLLVIIAAILIFVEAGGYSLVDYLPYEAHPILGIIILCCVIINPIIALLRPSDDHECRPCVNWIHWAFGTIAWCLAIPNMFIGMDFGKAHVPWWSTWILFIYILFHIIVEVILEVHQCATHKKNKERRKKYEFQKRENPKANIPEPEPAGRIFKRNMLIAHFIVTCIVAFIMVIAIASG